MSGEGVIEKEDSFATKGGVRLAVLRKHLRAGSPRGVLVLVHGSTLGARGTFDLTVPGERDYSMMDWFARCGYDVWAMDHEGYGASSITSGNSDIRCGAEDLGALMALISLKTNAEQVNVYGLSSGALRAALFAAQRPQAVKRLALDAFVWTGRGSATLDKRREGLPFFRANARRQIDAGMIEQGITSDRPDAFAPGVARAAAQLQIATGNSVPTGTFLDMTANLPVVDPANITAPTLLIRSEYDRIATIEDLTEFFTRLPSPDKQFVFLPGLAHSSILGIHRHLVWNGLKAFLEADAR